MNFIDGELAQKTDIFHVFVIVLINAVITDHD